MHISSIFSNTTQHTDNNASCLEPRWLCVASLQLHLTFPCAFHRSANAVTPVCRGDLDAAWLGYNPLYRPGDVACH